MAPARMGSARRSPGPRPPARSGEAATAQRTSPSDTPPPRQTAPRFSASRAKPRRESSATVRRTRSTTDEVWAGEWPIKAAPPTIRRLIGPYDLGLRPPLGSAARRELAGPLPIFIAGARRFQPGAHMTADGHFKVPTPVNGPVRASGPGG